MRYGHTVTQETSTYGFSDVCPVCGSTDFLRIEASSSDGYTSLLLEGHGSARLIACTKCGVVRLPAQRLKEVTPQK